MDLTPKKNLNGTQDWDKLCIVHCGDIDDMMDIIHYRQKHGVQEGNMILAAHKKAKSMKLAAAHRQALSEEAEEDTTLTDMLGNGKKLKDQGVNVDSIPLRVWNTRVLVCVCVSVKCDVLVEAIFVFVCVFVCKI